MKTGGITPIQFTSEPQGGKAGNKDNSKKAETGVKVVEAGAVGVGGKKVFDGMRLAQKTKFAANKAAIAGNWSKGLVSFLSKHKWTKALAKLPKTGPVRLILEGAAFIGSACVLGAEGTKMVRKHAGNVDKKLLQAV
ncbi:MAG: hypothetical protein LBK53_01315 [Heliobacteriaceae bacterium]|jgi:hypothetical protein|nr:hypothetical protein [Heliobacteriaceae bacterium]